MANPVNIANEADALYSAVAQASLDENGASTKLFSQEELLELSHVDDALALKALVQHLTDHMLLRTLKVRGKLLWSPRPRDAAKQITTLEQDDKMIYNVIEEAHTTGIWSRDIKQKTSIAQNAVTKSINKLERTNLIKSVRSVRNPAQRTYMLYHLVPSEDVTGNSFFDAGDLDESFRDTLLNLIIFCVRRDSWSEVKKKSKRDPSPPVIVPEDDHTNTHEATAPAQTRGKRKRTTKAADIEYADQQRRTKRRATRHDSVTQTYQLAFRAGSHSYPTVETIHQYISSSDAIKPTKAASLTTHEIQSCIDILVWDDKLEKIRNPDDTDWGYRTVRGVTFKPPGTRFDDFEDFLGNGLTQAPCGRCPVFDICHEDGPVNPAGCVYYDQWLKA